MLFDLTENINVPVNINIKKLFVVSAVSSHIQLNELSESAVYLIIGGYKDTRPYPSFTERIKMGFNGLKTEIAMWKEEIRDQFEGDPVMVFRPGEVDVVWRFQDKSSLDQWIVTSDQDHKEGFSSCSLTLSNCGKGLFSGELSMRKPRDGRVKRAGYCNIKTIRARKSFKRETYLDWTPYNMLVMKIRGDGRSYLLNVHTKGGGPYWQIVKIPFSRFFLGSKGRIQDCQCAIPLQQVVSFSITATERYAGEFSLEIDYIGLEHDPSHTEEFAYEMYALPKGVANT
ncbi:hypothetical protein GWI33_019944 [Rhynchophorus ferrugineus]|uniref:NADH:ubiquinone oxidoreductase intermediate-associated protein 30 domain-containing protein n=1 Tax=Rhynchophorus ferrugineus TaxID=354439 RepID=A0A834HSD5_RHYFE|nr:hypothetical protein GWI33_019944 [Rhynchophorus ferrugineus]